MATSCSNCGKNIWFFQTSNECANQGCPTIECDKCFTKGSISLLTRCENCDEIYCKTHIQSHIHTQSVTEENTQEEDEIMAEDENLINCENCDKEVAEEDTTECYNCNNQFCNDCIRECEECSESFCEECYTSDARECDASYEVAVGFKNSDKELIFLYDRKKDVTEAYAKIKDAVIQNLPHIEHDDSLIIVSEIKYIDLRL